MSDFPSAPPPPPPPPPQGPGSGAPPGYVAYGTPAAQGWTKPIRGLGKAAVILQSIGIVAALVSLVISITLVSSAEDFLEDNTSRSAFEDDLAPFIAVGLLAAALGIATLVVMIIWSFRIAKNLQARGETVTWKPGLTIVVWILGGCTLNIINFLMLREHWSKSDPERTYGSPETQRTSPLIVAWLVLTLIQVGTGLAAGLRNVGGFSLSNNTNNVAKSLSDQFAFSAVSSVIGIAATVVLIMIIRQLTERHARLHRRSVTLFLVRHAKAGSRDKWDGPDEKRPLSKSGWKQAKAISRRLHKHHITTLLSSPYVRCVQTLEPIGRGLDLEVIRDAWLAEGERFEDVLTMLTEVPDGSVLCTHGDLVPETMAALQRRGCRIDSEPDWRKGVVWVLERAGDELTRATVWPPPS